MATLLYCEDDKSANQIMTEMLQESFPTHNIISTSNLNEALKKVKPHLADLRVVVTDGEIINPLKRKIDYGWNLAEMLVGLGYTGPIVYFGNTDIPNDKKLLF